MNDSRIPLTDENLLSHLTNFEDSFVERKSAGDHKDWLKTVVAFANSTPIGYPAILFIGVKDDGTIEGERNLEKLQQTFTTKMQVAYPTIYFWTKILVKDGLQFMAVIVPGSVSRPHFAGPSYVRKGNRTEAASDQQFEELLASRLSKSGEILKWINRTVSVDSMRTEHVHQLGAVSGSRPQVVKACNAFYVTLSDQINGTGTSFPLRRVEVSFDNMNGRLKLEIYPV